MNISSENIKVFPFGTDRPTDPYARILNEQNIIRIVKNIVDNDSYVINYDSNNNIIEFMLCGYYFKAKLDNVWPSEKESPLYAIIGLVKHKDADYYYLFGGDKGGSDKNTSTFTGVLFSDKPEVTAPDDFDANIELNTYYLQLFSEDGTIPESSRLKFNNLLSGIDVIYCGTATDVV